METYKNLKKGTKIGLLLACFLILTVLVTNIFSLVSSSTTVDIGRVILIVLNMVISSFVLLYAFFGYKKPHGNMLKILFFAFSIFLAFRGTFAIAGMKSYLYGDLHILSALVITYIAGRLNKIEKNRILLVFVGTILLAAFIVATVKHPIFVFAKILDDLTSIISLAALSLAYVARYEEHKAAGLADKADAKEN